MHLRFCEVHMGTFDIDLTYTDIKPILLPRPTGQ